MVELLKYPRQYDERFLAEMEALGPEDISKVGRELLRPEDFIIVVVGNVDVDELVTQFGGEIPVFEFGFDTEPSIIRRRR